MKVCKRLKGHVVVLLSVLLVGCSTTSSHTDAVADKPYPHDAVTWRLSKIENEWAAVDTIIGKDPKAGRAVLERILAPDFVNTSRKGTVMNKRDFIDGFEDDGVENAFNGDIQVHLYADNVAVVTGIDNTMGKDQAGNPFSHQDRFTDTYVRRNGVWQCVAAQNVRIK